LKTIVYVDGFNLYYRALRGTPYKWLDLDALFSRMLPRHDIVAIKYFTAQVTARPHDPQQPVRQQTYLRALQTSPKISIHYGHFLSHVVSMPSADTPGTYVNVMKTEEKGSDVNLATNLLVDAFQGRYDAAVLVSKDSDLAEPIRYARQELGKVVGLLNPGAHPSKTLYGLATFYKAIRRGHLAAAQFPDTITDDHGTFHKPKSW
jgi:uncharacterized LabA/DUF88 family protein